MPKDTVKLCKCGTINCTALSEYSGFPNLNGRPVRSLTAKHKVLYRVNPSGKIVGKTIKIIQPASHVYVIKGERPWFKIGKANSIASRLSALQTSSPAKLEVILTIPTEDPLRLEAYLHEKFKKQRGRGEWFRLRERDVEWIMEEYASQNEMVQ